MLSLSRTIETIKYMLLEDGLYISIIAMLLALLIYNYNETLALENELVRVNNEFHVKQVTYEKRQKEYYEKVDQQQAKLDRMIKEINSQR
jgi:hypothetical protein